MNHRIYTIIALLLCIGGLPAQPTSDTGIRAWLEARDEGEVTTLRAWCANDTKKDRHLTYWLSIQRRDVKGNLSTSRQGGRFVVGAEAKSMLSSSGINRREGDFFKAVLEVFDSLQVIASDRFPPGEDPLLLPSGGPPELPRRKAVAEEGPEMGDLIIDDTRSRIGHEFYDRFYAAWQSADSGGNHLIQIEELPFRAMTTLIRISVDEVEVFQQPLQQQERYLDEWAPAAIELVKMRVDLLDQMRKDLSEDDRDGTGIY